MKLGMFFSHIDTIVEQGDAENISNALKKVVPRGIEYVDIDGASIGINHNVEEIKSVLSDNGVKTGSLFYLANFDWKNKNVLDVFKEQTKRQLEYCAYLGTDLFMPVPNITVKQTSDYERIECQKIVIEYFNQCALMSKEYNISTVVENFSEHANPYSKLEDFEVIFNNTSDVGYVLDTGNFWFSDVDYLDAYDKYHSITRHIHLKDIHPNKDGFFKINDRCADIGYIGGGVIDLKSLSQKLKKYNYNGILSIEINNFENMLENVIKSIDFAKKLF